MTKNKYFLLSLLLFFLAFVYYTFFYNNSGDPEEFIKPEVYRQQIDAERNEKNTFFRTSAQSPLTNKAAFKGLLYFAPDPAYRVSARLEPFADKTQKLVVTMTDGSEEVYDKFAHAVFSLNGKTCRLLVVKLGDTYSILFRDATSGKETYGGGRYIEISPDKLTDNRVILDFNTAYNPYCAYNTSYACPLPPPENTLSVAVNAGEKYIQHD